MNPCLVICPTYNRQSQFTRMAQSFYMNSVCSDLIVMTAKGSITGLINSVDYQKYNYVSVTNDDFAYNTYGWDKILIDTIERKGSGIAFGDDGTDNKHLPSTCIMSAVIPKSLGWIQLPGLIHLCGDMAWQYIGKELNCLYYVPSVSIEHHHFLFGKADKADYEQSNSKEMYQKDNETFRHWILNDSGEDIDRIRVAVRDLPRESGL